MRPAMLAPVLALIVAPQTLAAQAPSRDKSPTLAVTLGPSVIVETWAYSSLSLPDAWYAGASLGLSIAAPVSRVVAIGLHGVAFQAPGGRSLQSATAGLQLRVGHRRQVPLTFGFGAARQPSALLCVNACPATGPRFGHRTRATVAAAAAYEWRVRPGLALGPELAVSRALATGQRYYGIHLGLRLVTQL